MASRRPPGRPVLPLGRLDDDDPVRTDLVVLQPTTTGTRMLGVDQIGLVRLDGLTFEHQPREIVPEERLQALIAAGRVDPASVLRTLEEAAATDAYYAAILAELRGLATSIASQGVLQPIRVVLKGERLVVRDGHRRCLASLLAGQETLPAQRVEEPDELAAVAHPLIVNLQRQDLTAIEKGAAVLRLALAVGRRVAAEAGADPGAVTIEALVGEASSDAGGGDSPRGESDRPAPSRGSGLALGLAGEVRARVCAMTGLGQAHYYRYLALNRLTAEARAAGRGLTEGHLRSVVALPAPVQAEVLAFAVRRGLNSKEIASLAQIAREGDRDRLRARLAQLEGAAPSQGRTSVTWEGLLHAVPRDVDRRCQALAAELRACAPEARRKRIGVMREQRELLLALAGYFERLIDQYGESAGEALETRGGPGE